MTAIHLQDDAWEDIEEGTEALLDEWHVSEGDSVEAGQLVATVMVIKTGFDVVTPVAGTVGKLLVNAQDNFTRGHPLAEIN